MQASDAYAPAARIIADHRARVVFDPVAGPAIATLISAMAQHGILISYGWLSPEPTPYPLLSVVAKGLTLRGYTFKEIVLDPARLSKAKQFVLKNLGDGLLLPVIDRIFSFDEIVEAHRYLESNEQFGKIVVTVCQT